MTLGGTDTEALGHARAVALDEHVGAVDEPQDDLATRVRLQVDGDRTATAVEDGARGAGRIGERGVGQLVDAHDVAAHVGQHHPAERDRPDAGELDDLDAGERPAHTVSNPFTGHICAL